MLFWIYIYIHVSMIIYVEFHGCNIGKTPKVPNPPPPPYPLQIQVSHRVPHQWTRHKSLRLFGRFQETQNGHRTLRPGVTFALPGFNAQDGRSSDVATPKWRTIRLGRPGNTLDGVDGIRQLIKVKNCPHGLLTILVSLNTSSHLASGTLK